MKANAKTWILGTCIVFLLVFGTLTLREYMANHTYYYDMMKNTSNIYIILATLVCAALPLSYMLYWKNATLKGLSRATGIGLVIYGILYASIRENILGTGAIMWVINTALVFGLSLYMITGITAIGSRIHQKIYNNNERTRRQIILSFGLGFVAFTTVNYVLILATLFYGRVNRLQLIAIGYIIWKTKPALQGITSTITTSIRSLYLTKKTTSYDRIAAFLLLISFAYYFIGYKLAYIPYPTARDANHAYMLIPNAISGVHGLAWNTNSATGYLPFYLSYVSFFFSIIKALGSKFWISPDTFGVQMNYLTAIFTFITTLGIIDKVLDFISNKGSEHKKLTQALGWFAKILWLTSGMGAFLVFVDNKSDFGIMFLSCLGLYAGLGYVDYVIKKYNSDPKDDIQASVGYTDLLVSGLFFGIAIISKVTALFDAMNFILLIVGFMLGGIVLMGISLIIMAIFANIGLNGVNNFLDKGLANVLGLGGGAIVTMLGLGKGQYRKSYSYRPRLVVLFRHIAMRGIILVATIVVLKLPIALHRLYHNQAELRDIPKQMIFGQRPVLLASNNTFQVLLAQNDSTGNNNVDNAANTGSAETGVVEQAQPAQQEPVNAAPAGQLSVDQCSLSAVGAANTQDLYKDLLTPPGDGYNEDVGRYVGFGQKTFGNPWWGFLVPSKSCISINKAARVICQNQGLVSSLNKENANKLLALLPKSGEGYDLVKSIATGFDDPNTISTYVADSQKKLTDFRHDKTIYHDNNMVYVPYKLIVPLNVTFNRSLQNLSSYYTDIGIIRIILQFFLVVALIYGLITKNRLLRTTNLVAIIGWLFWIMIGGGIIWYGIGLITWTIIGFVLFVHELYEESEGNDKHESNHILFYTFCGLFVIFGLIQLSLNFIRIASQGGSGPFLEYSYSNGQALEIDDNLQQKVSVKFPYKWTDILDLQFPHYKRTLANINTQTGNSLNLIAGTYLQYRVIDQTKLFGDGLLSELWRNFSDWNLCKSYLRLKDKKLDLLIIDPNIASIVMGGGNSSLMERFFAKMDAQGHIVTDGTFSTIGKLVNAGYLTLYNTNNLGAKYGFSLPSDYLKSKFGITNDDDLAILRARLGTVRFRGNQQQMIDALSAIFTERVTNGEAIGDIADVYGKVVDENNLKGLVSKMQSQGFPTIANDVKALSQDERFVFLNYLNVLTTYNKQPSQFASVASNIVNQSLGGGSQLIVFKVK